MVATQYKTCSDDCHTARVEKNVRPKSVRYSKLKLLDPQTTPKRIRSHRELESIIAGLKGKHKDTLARELRLAFNRFLNRGYFSINRNVFDHLHGAHCRKRMMEILSRCTTVLRGSCRGVRSVQRVFTFSGIERARKAPTYSRSLLTITGSLALWVSIPPDWMVSRHIRWSSYCAQHNLPQMVDINGSTDWGRATLDVLDQIEVPTKSASEHGQAKIQRLTKTGVLRMVYRRHGRMYHPLTNLAKVDRRMIVFNGKPTGEMDMSACFTTLLAAELPAPDRQPIIARVRAGTWYKQFEPAYEAFALKKRAAMDAAGASEDEINERLKGVKVEFQRQCLFGADRRSESVPLWDVLCQGYAAFAALIEDKRKLLGVSGLASWLMQKESRIFVDTTIPALHRAGKPALGIHDGIVMQIDDVAEGKLILEQLASNQLGFKPGVSVK